MKPLKHAFRLLLVAAAATLALFAMPASAVTDGELDGNGHPAVVLLLMEVNNAPAFRCSATLLSATVVLTAGHCTNNFPGSPYTGMRVFTESDVQAGIGVTNNYPFAGPNAYEAADWAAHPLYETGPFFLHDVGVVVLAGAGVPTSVIPASAYGVLPGLNSLDALKPKRSTTFDAVGYGLQKSFPTAAAWKNAASRTRMIAHPHLVQINGGIVGGFSLLLSNNASTGGTCFGDSGGPNFLAGTTVVAGVTSFGLNRPCGGTGGVFRVDRADVLDFVDGYLNP